MKPIYWNKMPDGRISIADVMHVPRADGTDDNRYHVNRINVPVGYRGTGEGSKLLKAIVDDADAEGVVLFLDASPSGPLDMDSLVAWYKRYGFVSTGGMMRRDPIK